MGQNDNNHKQEQSSIDLDLLVRVHGRLSPDRATRLIIRLCDAMEELLKIKPGSIIYRDISLTDIQVDQEDNITIILVEKNASCESENLNLPDIIRPLVSPIQGIALLYYHLLTGLHPNKPEFKLLPFTHLGIYLPGELYDIITRATVSDPSCIYTDIANLKSDIETVYTTEANWYQEAAAAEEKKVFNVHRGIVLKIAGLIFSLTAAILICLYLLFYQRFLTKYSAGEYTSTHTLNQINEVIVIPSPFATEPPLTFETPIVIPEESLPADEPVLSDPATPTSIMPHVNKKPSGKVDISLSSLEPIAVRKGYEEYAWSLLNPKEDTGRHGKTFTSGIKFHLLRSYLTPFETQWMEMKYDLKKQYKTLIGTFTLSYASRQIDAIQKAWINIWGDDKLIFSSDPIGSDSADVKLNVSITDVKTLMIQLNPESQFTENAIFLLGDAVLIP